ncbi:ATP-binding protein [Heyndrickxia camelliae]|uniref:histidine kinase n=1 Tax=Heyndrickxia camelliae TaxID=1707093 RepID=A0A2N3LN25_9BACI|nr:ATP-binding protein [Heyndrickxia camelliae]PKR85949.1 PAS domain-containing sensor histidine kinase [Heyndrickxia camelliae]
MKIWKSVVGKLWLTILLLVSFVLFILTILLLEFFESYHVTQIKQELETTANKIAHIVEEHPNDNEGIQMALEIVDKPTQVIIAYNKRNVFYSSSRRDKNITPEKILNDSQLSKVFRGAKTVNKEVEPPNDKSRNRYDNTLVVGVPLQVENGDNGAIFIYQSLNVLKDTTQQTTKIILLSAGIAIILTTFFAFFLSTRIAAPLRRMRLAAFEVAKGKFDTKVPILTHDEIGELATAFNQMGRQLENNMNDLQQEKEQLTSILSSMADGVLTFDRDGTILITNPPGEKFLQQWLNDPNQNLNLSAPEEILDLLQKVIDTEKEQTDELKILGHSYVVIVSPLYNQRDVRGAVAVLRDMTEERKLDKLRDDFIANVSHELRTPIAMLQGYSEAIIDDIAATDEEKKEFAKIIYDETLRIGRLVNELLDLARMEAGHISLYSEETEIKPFIERVTNKFQGLARDQNVQLSYDFTSDEYPPIDLDPDRIEQVLTNLIDNAIRHTQQHGTVKVIVDSKNNGIIVHVEDNGSGIPEEDLPFVFERFYKADKARTRGKSGTGLGLAIAKNIVDAHNGHISVKSKIGQGTTFSFFLPYSS